MRIFLLVLMQVDTFCASQWLFIAMIGAYALVALSLSSADNLAIQKLSERRGEFERSYESRKEERLNAVEAAGIGSLGDPSKEWYYPAGSGEYRLWLIGSGPDSTLVCQSWHGKKTTTDWVIKLKEGPKTTKKRGTLMKLLARNGCAVASKLTPAQSKLLSQVKPYIGFTEGRGPYTGDVYTWFVKSDGKSAKGYYHCTPDPTYLPGGAVSTEMIKVLGSPPILSEESEFMGFKDQKFWHGPGKFTAEYGSEFKF